MHIENAMRKYLDMFASTTNSKQEVYEEYTATTEFEGELLNALLRTGELDDLYRRYGMDDVLAAVNYEAERSAESGEKNRIMDSIRRIKEDLARSSGEVDESK